jgi:hypothetical protein
MALARQMVYQLSHTSSLEEIKKFLKLINNEKPACQYLIGPHINELITLWEIYSFE